MNITSIEWEIAQDKFQDIFNKLSTCIDVT